MSQCLGSWLLAASGLGQRFAALPAHPALVVTLAMGSGPLQGEKIPLATQHILVISLGGVGCRKQ